MGKDRGVGPPPFKHGKVCTFCAGHIVDVCFQKHGYPPGSHAHESLIAHNVIGDHEMTMRMMNRSRKASP